MRYLRLTEMSESAVPSPGEGKAIVYIDRETRRGALKGEDDAVVALGGGLMLSAAVTFDTPDMDASVGEQGVEVLDIPAGSFFYVFPIVTEEWDQPGLLEIAVGSSTNEAAVIGDYSPQSHTTVDGAVAMSPAVFGSDVETAVNSAPRWAYAVADVKVCVAFFPVGDQPTAGAATIHAFVV